MDHLHSISAQALELVQPKCNLLPLPSQISIQRRKKGVIQTLGFLNNFLLEL